MISPKGEVDNRPRKFYTEVDIARHEPDGWCVRLDGKPLRTPEKRLLATPTRQLAELIADEWRAQGERIDLLSMSTMRLTNVALDRTPVTRQEIAAEVARYAETDLVSHLTDFPVELRSRQDALWGPLREWAGNAHGARLTAVEGIRAARQPPESLEAIRRYALSLDDFRLTALAHATAIFGSAVIGLAVADRHIRATDGCEYSLVDELFQSEKWGLDLEAERRLSRLRSEAAMLDMWFDALDAPAG